MPAPTLAETLRGGATVISAWVGLPEPLISELSARSGFNAVTLDVQHGLHDTGSVMRSVGAIAMAGKPAIVRGCAAAMAGANQLFENPSTVRSVGMTSTIASS